MPRPPLSPPLPRQFPLPPPLTPVSASLIQTGSAAGESPDHDKLATVADQPIGAGKAGFAAGSPIWAAQASEWTAAQEAALAELIGPAVLRRDGPTSADIPELIRGELNVSSGAAPASLPFAQGIAAVSSAGLNQAPPKPGAFWLNVNAELVLYGATEADAQVTVAGQPVQLRPDGTFSCRFALPSGFYQLAVQANSARGELRQAELDFSRATRFGAETGDLALDAALKPPVAPPPNPPYF